MIGKVLLANSCSVEIPQFCNIRKGCNHANTYVHASSGEHTYTHADIGITKASVTGTESILAKKTRR